MGGWIAVGIRELERLKNGEDWGLETRFRSLLHLHTFRVKSSASNLLTSNRPRQIVINPSFHCIFYDWLNLMQKQSFINITLPTRSNNLFYLMTRKTPNKNKKQKQWPKNRLQRQNDMR